MSSKIISGEFREDMSANSSMVRQSSRRAIDVSTKGMASVMNPVLWQGCAAALAGGLDPVAHVWVHADRSMELVAGADNVGTRLEEPAQDIDVGPIGHVQHAVRRLGHDVLDVAGRGHADGAAATQ